MNKILFLSNKAILLKIRQENPIIFKIFSKNKNSRKIRNLLFEYLNSLERKYYNILDKSKYLNFHDIEKNNAKECIRVLKNILRTENEKITNFSVIKYLKRIIDSPQKYISRVNKGFLLELYFLFRGIHGKSTLPNEVFILEEDDEKSSIVRSEKLDDYAFKMNIFFQKFKTGMDNENITNSNSIKTKILNYFKINESVWQDYHWHLQNIIKDLNTLTKFIELSDEEKLGLQIAEKNNIPYQITPYYLTLFNERKGDRNDRSIRSLVLPSSEYCKNVIENRENNKDMDFMGEKSTSPIKCITRRYPNIVILKPYNSCPQICIYCQRNWEIKSIEDSDISNKDVENAISWIEKNNSIKEVLITGGDPLTLPNKYIEKILEKLSKIETIERIRIGTRTLVTIPFRFDDELIRILSEYHKLGKREIAIITHFEHVREITPEVISAVEKIKKTGINIYNQQVFTYFNSFRYETAKLRSILKISGIDPYYSFNTKGKEETIEYRVPIARLEQERKEEARFLPGLCRTDEPVFNVPKLGKSHLRAWQDHEPIMILKNGKRVYRFFPWESKVTLVDSYIYTDVSIFDYLIRIANDGENLDEYKTIWYYF